MRRYVPLFALTTVGLVVTTVPALAEDGIVDRGGTQIVLENVPGLPGSQVVEAAGDGYCRRITSRAYVYPELPYESETVGQIVYYKWRGSGYTTTSTECAKALGVHIRVVDTAGDGQPQVVKGDTVTVVVTGPSNDSGTRMVARASAYVLTEEMLLLDGYVRGPSVVAVQVWGSYLSRSGDEPWVPIQCMERQFQVLASPIGTGTVVRESSYGPCSTS